MSTGDSGGEGCLLVAVELPGASICGALFVLLAEPAVQMKCLLVHQPSTFETQNNVLSSPGSYISCQLIHFVNLTWEFEECSQALFDICVIDTDLHCAVLEQ